MTRLAFDIETNGLLPDVSKLHCLVLKDLDSGRVWDLHDHHDTGAAENIADGLRVLSEADYVTGHNIVSYDLPVLQHLRPNFKLKPSCIVRDTFIMAKMIWPMDRLKELDFPRWRKGTLPGNMIGAHRLEAWGYRLGRMKGEYSGDVKALSKEYAQHGDLSRIPEWAHCLVSVDGKGAKCLDPWLAWNQPMQDYCVQDVEVTHELHKLIEGHFDGTGRAANGVGWSERSIDLEHRVWTHIENQTKRGYGFDLAEAVKLTAKIKNRQAELEAALVDAFGSWWQPQDDIKLGHRPEREYSEKLTHLPDITVKRFGTTGKELAPYVGPPKCGYSPDAPFVRITRVTFNPKSRQHLGERLQTVFGWVPLEFGGKDMDQAKVDETTIQSIPESVLPKALKEIILEFLINAKTLGQMADGKKSWIGFCSEDGRIHGRMDTLGTVSHRASHYDPNLGQVPAVSKEKSPTGRLLGGGKPEMQEVPILGWKGGYGVECRKLFGPRKPFTWQTGVDCSGLELRLLGHYLYPYDGGEFSRRVSSPGLDIHAENSKITGLSRADTKTVTYAFLYGAGALKIGLGVGVPEEEIEELATSGAARAYLSWARKAMGNKFIMPDHHTLAHIIRGQDVKKSFLEGISGLKDMQKDLVEKAKRDGYIVAIDGRKLSIRKSHATLNQALQGGGAIVCKEWLLETKKLLEEQGMVEDRDYGQVVWPHDEAQYEHMEEAQGEIIKQASKQSVRNVAKSLDFQGELDTEGSTGKTWFDTH